MLNSIFPMVIAVRNCGRPDIARLAWLITTSCLISKNEAEEFTIFFTHGHVFGPGTGVDKWPRSAQVWIAFVCSRAQKELCKRVPRGQPDFCVGMERLTALESGRRIDHPGRVSHFTRKMAKDHWSSHLISLCPEV